MKIKQLIFSVLLLSSLSLFGQGKPEHPMYVDFGSEWMDMLDNWEPGAAFSKDASYKDDNFFISRVRLKERFTNDHTQANKELIPGRKLCWWCPIGESTKQWGPLPRYNFEADNFSMWQYLDIHGNWSNGWMRVPGAFNDVAHKNGVVTGCLFFVDWAAPINPNSEAGKRFAKLVTKENGEFKYAHKLISILKYYGIDGLGINPEGNWDTKLARDFQAFLIKCHEIAQAENWPFRVDWYASNSNDGGLNFCGNSLNAQNVDWFGKKNAPVTDMYMLNYNWYDSQLKTSVETANGIERNPYDVYVGFDSQGRGWGNPWQDLAKYPISICIWGNHARSEIYQSSTDVGSSDLAIQNTYQKKLELLFTGGSRNPINTPALLENGVRMGHGLGELSKFHGFSKMLTAKSTLQELPFVTRFGLGNGMFFKQEGKMSFNHKWYNIGTQDYLPTWRWWISTDDESVVPANPIQCDFTFEDAWFAGSCLKIHGATDKSIIRLFKTKFDVKKSYVASITYKVNNGVNPKMKLLVSKEGEAEGKRAESVFSSFELPEADQAGTWKTVTIPLSKLGITQNEVLACIALSVENTTSDYEVLLGEMSIMNPAETYAPVAPTITFAEPLNRIYNEADAKVIFKSGSQNVKPDGSPVYNDEVDTWYFEIYTKQEGKEAVLCTTTTSWAAYVVGAPMDRDDLNFRIGVCAVAPDGKTKSAISWSESLTYAITPVETVLIDKPIIKAEEVFTVSFKDPTHTPATFEILDALSGESIKKEENALSLTTSLPTEGSYDLKVVDNGKETITRGLIQITIPETGALPLIQEVRANSTTPKAGETVRLTYTSRDGEGEVSKAIRIQDPMAFKVPSEVLQDSYPFTYSFWFKPAQFAHNSQGTNLLQKLPAASYGWPWANWGDLWVQIRPADQSTGVGAGPNQVSMNVCPYPSHDAPVQEMMSKGYSITPGVWTHLAVSQGTDNVQRMYINGKKVAEYKSQWGGSLGVPTSVYIGGSGTYKAGFDGWLDELQIWNKVLSDEEVVESMSTYFIAPDELVGYYTFEEIQDDYTYLNEGSNQTMPSRAAIVANQADPNDPSKTVEMIQKIVPEQGNPALAGTLPIETTAKWMLPGAEFTTEKKDVDATYTKQGKFDVTLTLTNMWGEDKKTLTDYIVVGPGVGIDDNNVVENLSVYPNPFVESVNVMFATQGSYTINVFNASGQKVLGQSHYAEAFESVNVAIEGDKGMYLVEIVKDNKCVRAFKISKK